MLRGSTQNLADDLPGETCPVEPTFASHDEGGLLDVPLEAHSLGDDGKARAQRRTDGSQPACEATGRTRPGSGPNVDPRRAWS